MSDWIFHRNHIFFNELITDSGLSLSMCHAFRCALVEKALRLLSLPFSGSDYQPGCNFISAQS